MRYVETANVPTTSLKPFPGNARRGKVDAIVRSIARGQYRSIVVRQQDRVILAGNHTWRASCEVADQIAKGASATELAEKYGLLEEQAAELLASPLAEGLIRVELIDCDEHEARRINLADNRLAELGDYDMPALANLLSEMPDLDGTGWTDDDVNKILGKLDGDDDDDAEPELGDLEYRVIVECSGEQQQAELLARFESEGLTCRALIS